MILRSLWLLSVCCCSTNPPAIMASTTTEGVSLTSTSPEWTVLYHQPGKMKGRGEFLRLMLEDKGVPYDNSGDGLYGPNGSMDMFRGSPQAIDRDADAATASPPCDVHPVLYPPAIWHRPTDGSGPPVLINQVGACMIYLGDVLGYAPSTTAERARANQILLNALDYISDGRSSFHPVKNHMSYNEQKEEGDKESKAFAQGRMLSFLHHFDKVARRNASGPQSPIAGGPALTYADFALFHVLDATAHQFNSEHYEQAWDKADVPALKQFYQWMMDRPNLKAYFASERCARTFVFFVLPWWCLCVFSQSTSLLFIILGRTQPMPETA